MHRVGYYYTNDSPASLLDLIATPQSAVAISRELPVVATRSIELCLLVILWYGIDDKTAGRTNR
jgi:hypothetical protein